MSVIGGQDIDRSPANAQQVFTEQAVASMSPQHVAQLLQSKAATIATLQHQFDWFKRQLFGKGC